MTQFNNALEIYKILPKTNCKKCQLLTCMAFAGAVFTGNKTLADCPELPDELTSGATNEPQQLSPIEQSSLEALTQLRGEIQATDLAAAARRIGAQYTEDRLALTILGKKVAVDQQGKIWTDIHVNPWLALPLYNYILHGGNSEPTGNWKPLRELPHGQDWYRLFGQQAEKPLKKLADTFTDLFEDMAHLFSGKQMYNHYDSDISVLLPLLPRVPLLICYWRPEGELASELTLFFDAGAEENLDIHSLYSMVTGFVKMLEILTRRHGGPATS